MSWKLHLLCLGSAIPFGLWAALMKKSGIGNPAVMAFVLFTGSMIPFLPFVINNNMKPNLRPGITLLIALAIAYGVAMFHGTGHRNYLYIIAHYTEKEVAAANTTLFFEMAAVTCLGNFLILGDKLNWQKALAMVTGGITIWLYTR